MRLAAATAVVSVAAAAYVGGALGAPANPSGPDVVSPTRASVIHRVKGQRPPVHISVREQRELVERHLDAREALDARSNPAGAAVQPGAPTPEGPPVDGGPEPVNARAGSPSTVELARSARASAGGTLIRRNVRNTVSDDNELSVNKVLLLNEPAAANDAGEVLYLGNTYGSRSANLGKDWVPDGLPGGPAQAPLACCDADVVHHRSLDTTFSVYLYTNSNLTRGVATIGVRKGTIGGGIDCLYDIDPGTNRVPDYPHIAVTGKYLYLATNEINSQGTASNTDDTWAGGAMRRFDATQMANCGGSVPTNLFRYGPTGTTTGPRTFVPIENSPSTMYWGAINDGSRFRLFRWSATSDSVNQYVRALPNPSTFANSDCRGGIGNFDWIERSTAFTNSGFRLRGAYVPATSTEPAKLWFVWNAAADATHSQAYVDSVIIRASDRVVIGGPEIRNSGLCLGFPTISGNANGDFALTVAGGGRAGGGGAPVEGYVSVDDESTSGTRFSSLTKTARGTHNIEDERFGDYFTIRKDDRCPLAWVATNYAFLRGNTSSAHVNSRYVEFGSASDSGCF